METELKNMLTVSAWVATSMTYAHFISKHTKPGNFRLLVFLPVILLLPYLPWYFSFISFRGLAAFFLVWLGVFKLVLLSFGLGPLSPSLPLFTFIVCASLPIRTKPNQSNTNINILSDRVNSLDEKGSRQLKSLSEFESRLPSNIRSWKRISVHMVSIKRKISNILSLHQLLLSATKLVVLAILTYILLSYNSKLHHHVLLLIRCLFIYIYLDFVLASIVVAVKLFFPDNLELEPVFNAPLQATSLQDFWGRRWNLNITAILRPSVYDPVRRRYGVAAGVMAVFLVSGLMHEVMFYYNHLLLPTGEGTAFFVLHGIFVVLENSARRAGLWNPPGWVTMPLTLGFVAVTAYWLFFPALVRNEIDEKVLAEYVAMADFAQSGIVGLFRWLGQSFLFLS